MNQSEWKDCSDPDRLLAAAGGFASPAALRRVACACCRRIFKTHTRLWHTLAYWDRDTSERWAAHTLLDDVAAAEASGGPGVSAERRDQIAAAATESYKDWQWANYRLGDTASGGDYEDALIMWKTAAAVTACCADDIRSSIADCLSCAADSIGFRWIEAEKKAAVDAERRVQADIIRSNVAPPPPPDPASLAFCTRCGAAVSPYEPSRISLRDSLDYGTTPARLDAEPHYWCGACGEHWLATNLMDTGASCPACSTLMPFTARHCGVCGAKLRA
jgi:hypothetical protein